MQAAVKRLGIWVGVALGAAGLLGWLALSVYPSGASSLDDLELRADGQSTLELPLRSRQNAPRDTYHLEAAPGVATLLHVRREGKRPVAVIRSGVLPGPARLLRGEPGDRTADTNQPLASLQVYPDWRDQDEDGFPDNLQLHQPADRKAFLDWFRYLAEDQYFRGDALDPEIGDCAALLRYAYREALRKHDGDWANRIGLRVVRPLPGVRQYNYPFTPLRADLFRLKPPPFQPQDLQTGAFGQFADAENLLLYNATRIGKDIERAQPGDLLFYRQEGQDMPFHTMIFLGGSMLEQDNPNTYVVYHTGPDGAWPGEIRRRTLDEMRRHPEPRWHPVTANPAFLGVYRWKIVVGGNGA